MVWAGGTTDRGYLTGGTWPTFVTVGVQTANGWGGWEVILSPGPGQTPPVAFSLFTVVGQNPDRDFLKLALTRTPDPIRSTRRSPDPNRPTYGS